MKIWIAGQIDSILIDSFRIARNYIEPNINNLLSSKDYGKGIVNWDVIIVISKDNNIEFYKYNKKTKETDIRLVIDINSFQGSNTLNKINLLLDSLIGATEKLATLYIIDFDYLELQKDLLNLKEVIYNQYES